MDPITTPSASSQFQFFPIVPLNNVTPLTYRDGQTLLDYINQLRDFINTTFLTEVDSRNDNLITQLNAALKAQTDWLNAKGADMDTKYADFVNQINTLVASINNRVGPVPMVTYTLTQPTTTINSDPLWPTAQPVLIRVVQDATGNRNITFGPDIQSVQATFIQKVPLQGTYIRLMPIIPANGALKWQATIISPIGVDNDLYDAYNSVYIGSPTSLTVGALNSWLPGALDKAVGQAVTTAQDNVNDRLIGTKASNPGTKTRTDLDGLYRADIDAKIPLTQRATANGVATLDATGKIPPAQVPAQFQRGTFAARPAANTVPAGTVYYGSDTLEQYYSDGAAWFTIGYGALYASAHITQQFTTTKNGPVQGGDDIPGLSVSFTVGTRPIKVTLSCTLTNDTGNSMTTAATLLDGVLDTTPDSKSMYLKQWTGVPASKWETVTKTMTISTLTPGTAHTIKAQLWSEDNTSNTFNAHIDAGAFLIVEGL